MYNSENLEGKIWNFQFLEKKTTNKKMKKKFEK